MIINKNCLLMFLSPKSRFHLIQQLFQNHQLFFGQRDPLAHCLPIRRPLADVIFGLAFISALVFARSVLCDVAISSSLQPASRGRLVASHRACPALLRFGEHTNLFDYFKFDFRHLFLPFHNCNLILDSCYYLLLFPLRFRHSDRAAFCKEANERGI